MKKLPLFDLHCDTVTEAYNQNTHLKSNGLHLSFDGLSDYEPFCQVLAVWSSDKLTPDAAWSRFLEVRRYLDAELAENPDVKLADGFADMENHSRSVMLAVEGGKLIENDLGRLELLRSLGVRLLTLTWNDPCDICGANGTDTGVTDFGYKVLCRCLTLGIIPDISHASDKTAYDVIAYVKEKGGVCVATHSNSRTVCQHSRNLTDDIFKKLVDMGSLVGISMAPQHLSRDGKADADTVCRHIEHYLSLGGCDTVCLGCDFDGIEKTPEGITSVSGLYCLADKMAERGLSEKIINKIFYKNARDFFARHMK